jgi:alpha-D-ribose 1-methylphosphonate 5-triphosphate synthase subunit PhnG
VSLTDSDRYAHYVATRDHRRAQLARLVAADWEARRHTYWPAGDGVGQSYEALTEARRT